MYVRAKLLNLFRQYLQETCNFGQHVGLLMRNYFGNQSLCWPKLLQKTVYTFYLFTKTAETITYKNHQNMPLVLYNSLWFSVKPIP